jgi:hypothetical protein
MRYTILSALVLALSTSVVAGVPGQQPAIDSAPQLRFEVASIKEADITRDSGGATLRMLPSGRYEARGVSLLMLIARAYQVRFFQIVDGPVSFLISRLIQETGRMVVDRTGLTGTYEIDVRWAPDALPSGGLSSPGVSLFYALQEQLGLKLEAQSGPVELLVIDRVSLPTPD